MKNDRNKTPVCNKFIKYFKIIMLVLVDALTVNVSAFLSMFIRYEFNINSLIDSGYLANYMSIAVFATLLSLLIFDILNLYSSLWVYAGIHEALRIGVSSAVITIGYCLLIFVRPSLLPRSFPILNALILAFLLLAIRFSYRTVRVYVTKNKSGGNSVKKRTMIVGGGSACATIIRETQNSPKSTNNVVCIIDDDPYKHGSSLLGVKIVGGRDSILSAADKYSIEEIIIAIPSATAKERQKLIEICHRTGCSLRTLPGIYQLMNGEVSIQKIRKVEIEDLLGRESVKVDNKEISGYVKDKTVLVTGGGGSIGSELCRQVASNSPKRLIIFDIYENNAYSIQQELKRTYPELDLVVLIGSVRDVDRIDGIFEKYRPDIVYHAAAHKHVPLMEDSPNEAIKNNVFGTYNTAAAADRYGASTFILISTDKAVNPTNIMGASKRVCEMVVQYFASTSKTKFSAVRFGNVLGSNGSVVPLFKKQIEQGGPVTVTHPDIIRFFMTIPEAVSLVLQAGAYANNGEIFVLDMGDPVRIDDLARNMIRLSGFEPDVDIKIEYSGLRDGEKLYEELLLSGEGLGKTPNNLIFIGHPQKKDDDVFRREMEELRNAFTAAPDDLRNLMCRIVPEYHPELGGQH